MIASSALRWVVAEGIAWIRRGHVPHWYLGLRPTALSVDVSAAWLLRMFDLARSCLMQRAATP